MQAHMLRGLVRVPHKVLSVPAMSLFPVPFRSLQYGESAPPAQLQGALEVCWRCCSVQDTVLSDTYQALPGLRNPPANPPQAARRSTDSELLGKVADLISEPVPHSPPTEVPHPRRYIQAPVFLQAQP